MRNTKILKKKIIYKVLIRRLLKRHFVKTKHIEMRRDIGDFLVSPEHLEKCSYEVLTRHYQHVIQISIYFLAFKIHVRQLGSHCTLIQPFHQTVNYLKLDPSTAAKFTAQYNLRYPSCHFVNFRHNITEHRWLQETTLPYVHNTY